MGMAFLRRGCRPPEIPWVNGLWLRGLAVPPLAVVALLLVPA